MLLTTWEQCHTKSLVECLSLAWKIDSKFGLIAWPMLVGLDRYGPNGSTYRYWDLVGHSEFCANDEVPWKMMIFSKQSTLVRNVWPPYGAPGVLFQHPKRHPCQFSGRILVEQKPRVLQFFIVLSCAGKVEHIEPKQFSFVTWPHSTS